MAIISGTITNGNDNIIADAANDSIDALTGNDSVRGGAGNDTLIGGDGRDTLNGEAGHDSLDGGNSSDTLIGGAGNDILNGGNGFDLVQESGNVNFTLLNDSLIGNGNDTLISIENVFLTGGAGNNTLNALEFTAGSVTLNGGAGNDIIMAGTRDDTLTGGLGDDFLNGSGGFDEVVESGNINFTLSGFTLTGNGTDTLNSIERVNLTGGAGSNKLDAADFTVASVILSGLDGNDTLTGGSKGDILYGGKGNDSLNGGDGNDYIYDLDGGNDILNGGDGGDYLVAGSGDDRLDGGVGDDALLAGDGNDTLLGGLGNDVLIGESGNDSLNGGDGNDRLQGEQGNDILNGGAGIDEVSVSLDADLNLTLTNSSLTGEGTDTLISIEKASLGGSSGANALDASAFSGAVFLSGDDGIDTLTGGDNNDTLYGFDAQNADLLNGGKGDDFYEVDGRDIITESVGGGIDTVKFRSAGTIFSFTLPDNVENLELVVGSTGIGNSLNNLITGSNSNDTLDAGVSGFDILRGGLGDDTYIVIGTNDTANDTVSEDFGAGVDTVRSNGSFTLGANVENLTLTASGRGTGNDLSNIINGSSDADILDGGVSGNDILRGGAGNDTYVVTGADDTVSEDFGAGVDTVWSYGSFTLGANVEYLTLRGSGTGTGNELDNAIIGSSDNDTLAGMAGHDTLVGGAGNDSLSGDLLFSVGGDDILFGGAGNDTLSAGLSDRFQSRFHLDMLSGGTGADIFVLSGWFFGGFDDYYRGNGHATITDFSVSEGDKIDMLSPSSDYTLILRNYGGSAAQDTLIERGVDLIAIVLDVDLTNIAGQVFI